VKPLLVGEANPYGGSPEFALYPHPRGCAGDRLCRIVLGMEPDRYLDAFDRVNLCPERWSIRQARERAAKIVQARVDPVPVVLLGARVCAAFGLKFQPFSVWERVDHRSALDDRVVISARAPSELRAPPRAGGVPYVLLPHPSGRSRLWDAPGSVDRARCLLRQSGIALEA